MLKDKLQVRPLGTITPAIMPLTLEDRGKSIEQPLSFGEYRDYEVKATFVSTFSACDTMLDFQVRNAKRHIMENVYIDVRRRLHQLRMLVASGRAEEALKLIDEIDTSTKAD